MVSETNKLTHLDLFSGYGGLSIAAEWAGFTTVAFCEWDDYPTAILEKRWPDVPRWRDIRTLTGDSFYERTGLRTVNVISGGFPCQPFSVAGQRRGTEDDRYLWPEMLRVIKELRPTWLVGENVAGLAGMGQPVGNFEMDIHHDLGDKNRYQSVFTRQERSVLYDILQDIEEAGYAVQTFITPAVAVDAPHRRDRVAIVGWNTNGGDVKA